MLIVAILVVVVVAFWVLRGKARTVVVHEIVNRDRLAYLLAEEMRRWEAADPVEVSRYECQQRGIQWVLERANVPVALAGTISAAAYSALLREKIRTAVGGDAYEARVKGVEERLRMASKDAHTEGPLDDWAQKVEFLFEELLEIAHECSALSPPNATKHYQLNPPTRRS